MLYSFMYVFVLLNAVIVADFGSFTTAVDMYACVTKMSKALVLKAIGKVT